MSSSDKSQEEHLGPSGAYGGTSDTGFSPKDSQYVAGEMAQALKEIARGEQTASMLESNLTSLEAKLDAILAAIENTDAEAPEKQEPEDKPRKEPKG